MNYLIEKACTGWDSVNWSRALYFWQAHCGFQNKRVLELGCGCDNGGLSLWAAKNGASHIVCSDYNFPRPVTMEIHKQHGFKRLVKYEQIDALQVPYEHEFDIVIFKSMLGGIIRDGSLEVGTAVLAQAAKALEKGGFLVFAENLAGTRLHQILRNRFGAGKNSWRYFEHGELNKMIEGLPELELIAQKSVGFLGCFGRSEPQRTILGKIDKLFLERFIPEKCRYIHFLVARKL